MNVMNATGTIAADLNELTSGNLKVGISRGRGTSLVAPNGSLIQSQVYLVDTFLAMGSVQRYADNEFYFSGGYYRDSCIGAASGVIRQIHPAWGKMDSLGTISYANYYRLNTPHCGGGVAAGLEVLSNGDALLWGELNYALRVSATGDVIWAHHYGYGLGLGFMKELPNGDVLAGFNTGSAGAVVARLNAAGESVWCRSYFRPSGMVSDCIVESDDALLVVGYTDSLEGDFISWPPDFDPKLFALKLNGSGEVQWCKGYSAAQPWYTPNKPKVVEAHDGSYVILGDIGNQTLRIEDHPFLMKTDHNGDTLWTRSLDSDAYTYEIRDLLAYSDGGYLFNGYIYGDFPGVESGKAFLYKTDSMGHLPCSVYQEPLEVMDLFPSDSAVTLASESGADVRQAFIAEWDFPLMETLDACLFTSLEPQRGYATKPRIRPNPTTGLFTVQFADPLLAESYYSVYDTMGKLLLQRRLPTGATVEEVDLSRFGPGTYVVKFTSPDGVCHERVVVE